jgi:type I restriction enzyme S subunit
MRDLARGIGFGTTELIVARPLSEQTTSEFINWLFASRPFRKLGEAAMYGAGGQKRVPDDFVRDWWVAFPPLREQGAIVAFLDRETAKIDVLAEEQQRLIALLKEKRQAVVSHAVTKGLNSSAPMKDSGIEWLGEVPAHWEVKRLRHISRQLTVGIVVEPSKYYSDEGIPALRSLNVRPGRIELENVVSISEEANELQAKSKLNAGDLVAVRTGQPGTAAVIPPELDGCNCIDLIIIRRPTLGTPEFLCWYFASEASVRQFSEGSGGAIQQHFNVSMAADLIVAWPSTSEQQAIVEFLDFESAKLDRLIAEAENAITLLRERRSALISAAVTGKIDIRGLAPADAEAA